MQPCAVIFLLAISYIYALPVDRCTTEWNQFKVQYNKLYETEQEETQHFQVFCTNLEKILQHNEEYKKGETSYEMGVNQFTDLTDEEMKKYNGLLPHAGILNDESICSNEWNQFKVQYNKLYETEQEETQHFQVFCTNLEKILQYNEEYKKGETNYEMGVNQFTDLTDEEMEKYKGLLPHAGILNHESICNTEWNQFKDTYSKSYTTEEEETRRFNIFCKNLQIIEKHNKDYDNGLTSYKMGVNQFADLTDKEMQKYNGLIPPTRILADNVCEAEWSSFKNKFNKLYEPEEETRHQEIFCENLKEIKHHNEMFKQGLTTYEMEVNEFADLSEEEMKKHYGLIVNNQESNEDSCTVEWEKFKEEYNKLYNSEEEIIHQIIFCQNLEVIRQHNEMFQKGLTTYKMGINEFADLTNEEMKKYQGLIVNSQKSNEDSCTVEWQNFKDTYNKLYNSEEEIKRQRIFCDNVAMIKQHNEMFEKGLTTYEMGINEFADLTEEEMQKHQGLIVNQESNKDSCIVEWENFKDEYNKLYNLEEEIQRQRIFCENLEITNQHNELFKKGLTTYEMGINEFSDLTEKEMKKYQGLVVGVQESNEDVCKSEWTKYKETFDKIYNSEDEENRRFGIFCDRFHQIIHHNEQYEKGLTTFKMDVNRFTDMTSEEIAKYMGFKPHVTYDDVYSTEWQKFKEAYKKLYQSEAEEQYRFNIFCENFDEIIEHNKLYEAKKTTFKMGVTRFADMTHAEYLEWVTKFGGSH